jgi:hypothetical protein
MTESDIKTMSTLKEEGWYWIAETHDPNAEWYMAKLSKETFVDADTQEETVEWEFTVGNDELVDFLTEDFVLLGPVPVPEVAIPMAAPRTPLALTPVPVVLPQLIPTAIQPLKPALVKIK